MSSQKFKKVKKSFNLYPHVMDEEFKKVSELSGYEQSELINASISFLTTVPLPVVHNIMGLYKFNQACLLDPDNAPMYKKRIDELLKDSGFVKLD